MVLHKNTTFVFVIKGDMIKRLKKHSHLLHKTGLWLSILCTIHCLAMPILLTAMPFLGDNFINESTEHLLIGLSFVIALFLLSKDFQIHQNKTPFVLLITSMIFNCIGLFVVDRSNETVFVVFGASLMSAAYIYNWWLHKKVCHSHSH